MEAEQAELELASFPASGALASLSEAQRQRRASVRLRVEQAELVLLEACFGALVFYAHGHRDRGALASKTSPPKPKRVPSAEELRAAVLLQAHISTPTQPPNPDPNPNPSP